MGWMGMALHAADTEIDDTPHDAERHLELDEVTVSRTKNKYSKKGNPAVEFVERVMAARHLSDPRANNDYYNYGLYERINIGLLNFKADSAGMLGFLNQYLDESPLSGDPVLNLTVKEKVSDVHYRRSPEATREVVRVRNNHGLDDMIADAGSMQVIADDVLRPIDLYSGDDIAVLRGRFVSPLGRVATDFYKYYLSDTIADEERGDSLIVLSFLPHNPAMAGFNGRLYVVKGDSAMFIRKAEMRLPKAANVNYINNLLIMQEYDRAPDGSRLILSDKLMIEASALGQKAYAARTSVYNSHSFSQPADTSVFSDPRKVIERKLGESIVKYRPLDSGHGESNMESMIADMRSRRAFRYTERTLRALVNDRIPIVGRNAPVAYGPIFSTVSRNGLEGWRLRLGLVSTAHLSPHWFGELYGAYGFGDHRTKYGASVEYSFNAKQEHQREFPIRSLRLAHSYDVDKLGQGASASDAIYGSLTHSANNLLTYRRESSLKFTWETYQQFSLGVTLSLERQEATRTVAFTNGLGQNMNHLDRAAATIELRYAPGEKYYQSNKSRKAINSDAPIFTLSHTFSPKGLAGARNTLNKTELSAAKRFWFSAWGHLDTRLAGGLLWNQTDFPYLLMPEANLSYIFKTTAFSMMEAMEFVNDSYVTLHLNYSANGALFNYIPLLKKLKLREVIGFHSVWGHLSNKNNPSLHDGLLRFPTEAKARPMGSKPYMELNVGIENIFTILRVDYVRRLNYLAPGVQANGVRFSLHFNF